MNDPSFSRPAFFDTNIILSTADRKSERKQATAVALFDGHLRSGTAVLSLQVLQECYNAATRRMRISADDAQRMVELAGMARIVALNVADVLHAIEIHRRLQISFWDGLILQAARVASVSILYSEDLPSGALLAGVRIVNPFA